MTKVEAIKQAYDLFHYENADDSRRFEIAGLVVECLWPDLKDPKMIKELQKDTNGILFGEWQKRNTVMGASL